MCGIAGFTNRTGSGYSPHWSAWLSAMGDAIGHRGPDDKTFFMNHEIGLAFRRLALVDLDRGAQPLSNEKGDLLLICNGEIFNHRALRNELVQKGHVFATGSDVEVILHLYEECGMDLLDRLDGQFAFALHDRRRSVTYLVRDPFGICPLFFAPVGADCIFASEIEGILAHPAIEARLDLLGLDQVVILPGLVSPRTMFEGVRSVPPGSYVKLDSRGIATTQYWDLNYPVDERSYLPDSFEGMTELLRAVLANAVRMRMAADVPVGAYLSGGLDSSLVAALAAAGGEKLPATFSIGYDDNFYDESAYSDVMAGLTSHRHFRTTLSVHDIAAGLAEAVKRSACPLRESYNVASMILSRSVRSAGLKAVLGGEGADELFAGYTGYRFDRLRADGTLSDQIGDPAEERLRQQVWGDAGLRYEHDLTRSRVWATELYSREVASQLGDGCLAQPLVDATKIEGRDRLHQRSYLDVKLRLADHLLGDHGDRMAMANSVEVRYPFLSRGIAELVVRMPPWMKLRCHEEKAVLRAAAKGIIPERILQREKFSWAAHGSSSLLQSGALRPEQADLIDYLLSPKKLRDDGIFDPQVVQRLCESQMREPHYDPNGKPDLLMIVLTAGLLVDAYRL